jgi:SAM-dependent methyltransferase
MSEEWRDQAPVARRLPPARLVDRRSYLTELSRGRRVVHVGFADVGFRAMQERVDGWLHAHLDRVADELVGLDLDPEAVAQAQSEGWEAQAVDCTDPEAVRALGMAPADLVVAGEVIEHVGRPADLLCGFHELVKSGGRLALTTPNASGWLNAAAAVAGYEVNHPDHIVLFTGATLSTLLERTGWELVEMRTYSPVVKPIEGADLRLRVLAAGARSVLWAERTVGRVAPYVASGLIALARPARS